MSRTLAGIICLVVSSLVGVTGCGTSNTQGAGDAGSSSDMAIACGAAGQPCCMGTSCDKGLACTAGACNKAPAADVGKPCKKDADCLSGICISDGNGMICTDTCGGNADCIAGWSCGPVGNQKACLCGKRLKSTFCYSI